MFFFAPLKILQSVTDDIDSFAQVQSKEFVKVTN